MTYKVGTHINLKARAKRQKFIDEATNSLFWATLVLGFLYCLYA
jgi:hypothetical protein